MATRVKIVIWDGIITNVLADDEVDVEIVDVDKDYEDHDALVEYEEELHRDQTLKEQEYTVAHFEAENGKET